MDRDLRRNSDDDLFLGDRYRAHRYDDYAHFEEGDSVISDLRHLILSELHRFKQELSDDSLK